jgi:hypothetical protein
MVRPVRFVIALVFLAVAGTALAQFGHPLKGTWTGDWGAGRGNRTHVVLEFNWDGKAITGTINPGADGVPLKVATLEPATWTVHFEGDGKDKNGASVHYVVDGKIENLGSYARVMTGTWTQGSAKGDFKITRN